MNTWKVRGKWGLKDEGRGAKREEHALQSTGPMGRAWASASDHQALV